MFPLASPTFASRRTSLLLALAFLASAASAEPAAPEDIRSAEALLRSSLSPKVSLGEAMMAAERQGFSCYWGRHILIHSSVSSLFCSRSCDTSVRNGWWVFLQKPHPDALEVSSVHGHMFAPRNPRRCEEDEPAYVDLPEAEFGFRYQGDVVRGAPHGMGVGVWRDGSRYEGKWKAGRLHGAGLLVRSDGTKYEGEFVDGRQAGRGKLITPSGEIYEGDWRDNHLEGIGTLIFSDGSLYEGEFARGLRAGRGSMRYANGDQYIGDWKDDRRQGHGYIFKRDGTSFEGVFFEGEPRGEGRCMSRQQPEPRPCDYRKRGQDPFPQKGS
jgi:hypothetical protein